MYKNKTVLITGASRGVGSELVKYFIENNAIVIGISKGESKYKDENYHHYKVDISNPDNITTFFRKELKANFNNIDILINNAAVLTSMYSMIMPIESAVKMVNVNLLGVFFITREAAKLMKKNKHGRIINIGSMASVLNPIGDSIYAATKQSLSTLSQVFSKEFSTFNITCNTLAITAIETDMLNQHTSEARVKINEIIRNLPIPRMTEIDDITNVISFFASEKSSYITGQTIYLGGLI